MSVGNLTLRWSGILMGILFMAVVLTACGGDSAESTSTINGDSGAWEEYEAFCSEAAQEELDDNEDYTNGEVSTFYAELVERMESIDPPVEIADWHDRVLAAWTAATRLIDAEPQDAIFDPLILFSDNEILSRFGEVEEAFNEIPADVRERLAAAGCSDDADSEPTRGGESDTPQPTATTDSGRTSTGPAFLPTCEPRSRDEAALVAFYNATDGPNWTNNTNWLTDAPLGDWAGVSANRITMNGRVEGECVTQLGLRGKQLSGEIPAALGNLLNLADLDLSDNQLSGEIPAALGNLPNLQRLNLSQNQLSGEIPAALGNLPNLQRLNLSGNQLSGEIPVALGNLASLQRLSLSGNQLSGEIPAALGNLANLQRLYLSDNQLSGEIPVELGKIPSLRLDGNQLSGRILRPNGTNPQYAWDGSTIRVSWDAVDGADYYKVYHDDFFDDACQLGRDGSPRFCEELAANVTGTTYVHTNPTNPANPTNPGGDDYYYWVVSCNSSGCSEIDKENPAQLIDSDSGEAEPRADSSTATPRGAPTPAPTQTATPTATPDPTSNTPMSSPTSSSARDRDGNGLIEVDTLTQLDAIRWDLDGDGISDDADYAAAFPDANTGTSCSVESCAGYELTANLDFDTNGNGEADEGDAYWNSGAGWIPIGEGSPFVATFEGGGHTISNLYIRRTPDVGLFGVLGSGSTVSGIGLVATSVGASGYGSAGALAGIGHGVIEDSFADGLVAGCVDEIGGLVGVNEGSIANSHSAVDVINAGKSHEAAFVVITNLINDLIDIPLFISSRLACYGSVGGLVGDNKGTIAGSHSTSVVSGLTDNLGGLVGVNSGAITDSYATGSVSGKGFADLGGLVGANEIEGKVITSYATGDVSGQGDNFGGLSGVNSGVIAASYAAGSVSGNGYADVGGLVGDNGFTGVITAAYAEGSVSGRADRYGGLLGSNQGLVSFCFSTGEVPQGGGGLIDSNGNYGTVANCYWDTETSDQSDSAGGDGKTTAGLQSPTGYTGAYADWNVDLDGDGSSDDPWRFGSATEYPVLKLGTIEIDHGNLNARPPLEDKRNEALCSAVNYADIEEVNAQIEAGIDVNDTCQSATAWYDGLTPLAIAKKQGGPAVEAILVEAGAVNAEN